MTSNKPQTNNLGVDSCIWHRAFKIKKSECAFPTNYYINKCTDINGCVMHRPSTNDGPKDYRLGYIVPLCFGGANDTDNMMAESTSIADEQDKLLNKIMEKLDKAVNDNDEQTIEKIYEFAEHYNITRSNMKKMHCASNRYEQYKMLNKELKQFVKSLYDNDTL